MQSESILHLGRQCAAWRGNLAKLGYLHVPKPLILDRTGGQAAHTGARSRLDLLRFPPNCRWGERQAFNA